VPLPLLEADDLETGLSEPEGYDTAAGAGADDEDVCGLSGQG